MTYLATVNASAPAGVVKIPTLEISRPDTSEPLRTCAGYEDQTATLETGETVTFIASGMAVALPKRGDTGQQNLTFAVDNVMGVAQRFIDEGLEAGQPIDVIYREYLSNDMTAPAEPPLRFKLVDGVFEGAHVEIIASYMAVIMQEFMSRRYTATFARGLKYIGRS
ncbi:DUF1833 family protein [Stutzerimonas xanthomarina]|uniref:DUF1833 family protein n=1 Tax=Stutzerimonas xanthomarina TaxID=271420 RepID=UPI003AA8FBBE